MFLRCLSYSVFSALTNFPLFLFQRNLKETELIFSGFFAFTAIRPGRKTYEFLHLKSRRVISGASFLQLYLD